MSHPDFQKLQELFAKALELAPDERDAFVVEASEGDAKLLAELRRMLARHAKQPADFLVPPEVEAESGELIGQRLGEFEITREIGRGSMGVVFEARQTSLDRLVALKVLREGLLTTDKQIERFHREARAAAKLQHPHIVNVLADGVADRTHWFAMELVDGHDLDDDLRCLREKSASILPTDSDASDIRAAARVVAEIAEALEHAHAHGLVHRDVKPSNILLTREGRAMLADFGIVRDESLGKLTQTGFELGSLYYMSPEQARLLEKPVDHRTDVYSLGVVLYELLAKQRPFGGKTQPEILTAIRRGEPKNLRALNKEISRELATICAKAMHRDAERRYASAAEFAADLHRFLRGEAVHAKPPTFGERVATKIRRHRTSISLACVILLAGGVLVWQQGWLRAQTMCRVSVSITDKPTGAPVAGTVSLRVLNPKTGLPGTATELGRLPIRGLLVEPAYARLVVELDNGAFREFTRELPAGEVVTVLHELRAGALPGSGNMARIEGGLLDKHPTPNRGRDPQKLETLWRLDAYDLDRFEVSNADWRLFLADQGDEYRKAATPQYWSQVQPGSREDRLPVTFITWGQARDYAEWAGKRLPAMAEWVWAARNGARWDRKPWGAADVDPEFPMDDLRTMSAGNAAYFRYAAPVDSAPQLATPAPTSLHWMLGNAQEWTETPPPEKDGCEFQSQLRFALGHGWIAGKFNADLVMSGANSKGSAFRRIFTGFRCARSVRTDQ